MTADQVRELLRKRANGNQAAWAKEHGIAPGYVSDVLNGRRDPGCSILRPLGLQRITTYERAA